MPYNRSKIADFSFISILLVLSLLPGFTGISAAAPPNRVTRPVNRAQIQVIKGNRHPLALPQFDRGMADPAQALDYVLIMLKPSAAQKSDLEKLLAAQQNPSSPDFHKWLTPEQFADRFGVSSSDNSKVVAWLQSEGLTVNESARGRNWVAFSGTVANISRAFKTEIHRYQVNGAMHIANATDPAVPEALAEIVGGFRGLNDFHPKSMATKFTPLAIEPDYNSRGSHYLVPQDYATIYDVTPLYQAGFDGTGQSIAIVGQTDIDVSDITLFRKRYKLPANDPIPMLYGVDPGTNDGDQVEADLDLEWSGAIAPNATIYYVYGQDAITAAVVAVNENVAPQISISYGTCEIEYPLSFYEPVAQQANAQGITILSASGDSGAAGCDAQGLDPFATRGETATFPSNLPEVTGVGGTAFNEGNGNYWASTNASNFGSALSYIPEVGWNETSTAVGLGASGGGVSALVSKPAWQAGPGVPNDNARDVPDVAMSAAIHDGYMITYQGSVGAVAGTSAASPSLSGIVALLNQYQVSNGFQQQPGLGNINPQLYRLAQSAPAAFHDITSGNNIVPCAQGTPSCLAGSYGYSAGPGYDPVTGLGSVDANSLVTQWNTATNAVTVTVTASPAAASENDNVQLTATVVAAGGTGTPTGTISFGAGTGLALGTASLAPVGGVPTASVTFQASLLGAGSGFVEGIYSGDAAFSSGSGEAPLQIATPTNASTIEVSVSQNPVYAAPPDAQGPSWQTVVSLAEVAGIPSILTGFTIGGQAQPLAKYFPSTSVPAYGVLTASVVLRNLAAPLTTTLGFTGIDSAGNTWTRHLAVTFLGPQVFQNFTFSAVPLTMLQNPGASASCQWSQLLTIDETGGYAFQVTDLIAGSVDIANQIPAIFGTTRLAAYGSISGTYCWNGIQPPANNTVLVQLTDEFGDIFEEELTVSFAGPASNPTTISASPGSLQLQQIPVALMVGTADKTQSWTASVFPANRTTSWLTLSQYSGTGPARITATASGTGFEPGVYRANIVLQSANAVPQFVTIPVMFVWGATSGGPIVNGVTNAESYQAVASPGMLMAVFGSQLANATQPASTQPFPYTMAGLSATVNGIAAPLFYVSPVQVNIQVPYEAGAGPAVLGLNNNGQISGYQFQIAPSAPGIAADNNGNVIPNPAAQRGSVATLYITGDGDVTPALPTGFPPTILTGSPQPLLPLTVTVGGVEAFLEFVGIPP
ncbi:MAG: protease pro-enzyme activation domain-containing protein, partial [Bryobacteraceae bacterium]